MSDETYAIRTPTVRLSFPNLLAPRAFKDKTSGVTGKPRYSADFIMEPSDLEKFKLKVEDKMVEQNLKVILATAAREKWGQDYDLKAAITHGGLKWPIKDGNKITEKRIAQGKKHSDVTSGKVVISSASNEAYPPQLYILDAGKAIELERIKDKDRIAKLFVGGMYVVGGLRLKANETPQGRFLNLYLNSVLYVKPGERIGGIDGAAFFEGIEGGEADFDPTAGADVDL